MREKRLRAFEPDGLDLVADGVPRRLAKTHLDEATRDAEVVGELFDRDAVCRLLADDFDNLDRAFVMTPEGAGRGAVEDGEGAKGLRCRWTFRLAELRNMRGTMPKFDLNLDVVRSRDGRSC